MKRLLLAISLQLLLTGCQPGFNVEEVLAGLTKKQSVDVEQSVQNNISVSDVLKADKLIALKDANTLYLIDPDYPKPIPLHMFADDESVSGAGMDQFNISPSKQWIIWYSPQYGIRGLNTSTLKVVTIHPANDFLNTYPYVEFSPNGDLLYFITDKGNSFMQVDLPTQNSTKTMVPYPYGTVFKISPDQSQVLFISGFSQSSQAQFMLTDMSGKLIKQFTADIDLTDRHLAFWSPDSLGIFLVNGSMLEYYPKDFPDKPTVFFSFGEKSMISKANLIMGNIYIFTEDGYWHILDVNNAKELARAPLEIASELQKPRFHPWKDRRFLIEETVAQEPEQYNRLWLSDLRGVKKVLMEKYNQVVVQTYPQNID